ncbi:UDP-2,3-diacylglucosamine hydrolase [Burkholderia thailandensis]|nr:UDP-2,3-diacylglucosamine hydrolase [Burkholderia thailandensis]AOI51541.1 UDP-2,3-diacylglucosamine hydrolase [Burkholderia thailandensis]MDD1484042.1 UDP-2,3-diacylglucosamine hydrolase [Burkholderia thailandensis]MDD1489977.1 UDP-2,3-diacylglucosamine hydrolase [Burkholderia thailandensis]MDD1496293.1 UDP-2,3-diacylglucosamine hydrolase [Burkholderia thailandensis]
MRGNTGEGAGVKLHQAASRKPRGAARVRIVRPMSYGPAVSFVGIGAGSAVATSTSFVARLAFAGARRRRQRRPCMAAF